MIREPISLEPAAPRTIEGLLASTAEYEPGDAPPAQLAGPALRRWRARKARALRRRAAAGAMLLAAGCCAWIFLAPRSREGLGTRAVAPRSLAPLAVRQVENRAPMRDVVPAVPDVTPVLPQRLEVTAKGERPSNASVERTVAATPEPQRRPRAERKVAVAAWKDQVVRHEVVRAVRPGWLVAGDGPDAPMIPGYLETVVPVPDRSGNGTVSLISAPAPQFDEGSPAPAPVDDRDVRKDNDR